jgi:N-acetylglucosaminyldiphosphoundecaprenol N-acetyl-beta-D-mannosaminyltransferase
MSSAAPETPPSVELCGVDVHALTEAQCVEFVMAALDAGRGGWVVTPNLDHLRRLVRERDFYELCARADLRVADGMPLLWASKLQRTPLPERVAGSNLIWSVSRAAAERGRSVYLLGGDEGAAERAAQVLVERFGKLHIAGLHRPPFGFERDAAQMQRIVDELERAQPDLVLVALGSPKQERLIDELRAKFPRVWWLGIGISFSFVAGMVKRAPPWVQRLGLEWVHRLAQEPRRLFRRYLVDGLPFAARLLLSSAWKGLRRTANTDLRR